MNKELSLSEVIEYFKKNQISSFEDGIDEYGQYFITAARLAAVVVAPNPLTALSNFCSGIDAMSLRVSKLFSWLPDKCKYGNKGREKLAKKRYELSSIVYVKLLNIAITNAFIDELLPIFKQLLTKEEAEDIEKNELIRIAQDAESEQLKISINTYNTIDKQKIKEIIDKIVDPIFPLLIQSYSKKNKTGNLDIEKAKNRYVDKSYTLFNAFLINISTEFPEFTLWYDIKQKDQILNELEVLKQGNQKNSNLNTELNDSIQNLESNTKRILEKIETLNKDSFLGQEGFPSFNIIYNDIFKVQSECILDNGSVKN